MIQRISVRILLEHRGKPLLVRRCDGRTSILGRYELPGGKVIAAEQPDDAVGRYIRQDLGIQQKLEPELVDAITYVDFDDRDIQYAVITYRVSLGDKPSIRLSEHYDKYSWYFVGKSDADRLTDLTQLILGAERQPPSSRPASSLSTRWPLVYTDGGSRGNPGPSAAGFILVDESETVIEQGGEYLGITTNNQAEYQAVRLGIKAALARGWRRFELRADSLLVVNQLKGVYKIKNRELWPIYENIKQLVSQFESVRFTHVPRELNQLADGMVNKTLDAQRQLDSQL